MDVFKPDQPRSNIVDIGYMNMKPDYRCDITSEQVSQAFYVGVSSTEFTTSFFGTAKRALVWTILTQQFVQELVTMFRLSKHFHAQKFVLWWRAQWRNHKVPRAWGGVCEHAVTHFLARRHFGSRSSLQMVCSVMENSVNGVSTGHLSRWGRRSGLSH